MTTATLGFRRSNEPHPPVPPNKHNLCLCCTSFLLQSHPLHRITSSHRFRSEIGHPPPPLSLSPPLDITGYYCNTGCGASSSSNVTIASRSARHDRRPRRLLQLLPSSDHDASRLLLLLAGSRVDLPGESRGLDAHEAAATDHEGGLGVGGDGGGVHAAWGGRRDL